MQKKILFVVKFNPSKVRSNIEKWNFEILRVFVKFYNVRFNLQCKNIILVKSSLNEVTLSYQSDW